MPGMDGTGVAFEPLIRILPLQIDFKVVGYPGDRPLSFEETLCSAQAQIPDQNVVLIAESFSGLVAVALIGSGRIRARGLVLCAAFARPPRPLAFPLVSYLPLKSMLRLPLPRRLMARVVYGGAASVNVFQPLYQRIKAIVAPEVLIERLRQINTVDVRSCLSQLTLPCAYLQAAGDRTVPARALRDFSAAIPHLNIYSIPGPHFILQTNPRESWAAVADFMKREGLAPPAGFSFQG